VYEAVSKAIVQRDSFPHIARWFKHLNTFANSFAALPGQSCEFSELAIPAVVACSVAAAKATADDDLDLFGSDDEEEDAEAEALKKQRLAEYEAKKATKPAVIAKSSVIIDVKPWDDTTDLAEMEKAVRNVTMDGLIWGSVKIVPIGYGIKKLQISCAIEDAKVSMDTVEELIMANEDLVQSIDIVAFNKI
jgi:elongation factor 1-beta